MNRRHLRIVAGRPASVPPSRRHPPEHDLEWLLAPVLALSGLVAVWLLFEGLEYLPW